MSESQDRPRRPRPTGESTPQRGQPKARTARPPAATPPPTRRKPPPAPVVPESDALTLPAGALVALRRSGGLVFRSHEIVVYDDGRVETSTIGRGRPASTGPGRTLGGADLAALRRTVARIDFDQLPATVGQQRPDSFIYELAALAGGTPRTIEVADRQIPATVAPLIRQLNELMASEG